jgi:dCTP deaminase
MALEQAMITPFEAEQVRGGVISYGLSSYGYDIRIADEFRIFTPNPYNTVVDPKHLDDRCLVAYSGPTCIIPPNSFALARTVEYIVMPTDTLGIVLGKSTYARCGLVLNCTPLEPGWEGHITLEVSNTTPLPALIYANEGIGQILFFQGDEPCEVNYAMRKGKYQSQRGITLPKVE